MILGVILEKSLIFHGDGSVEIRLPFRNPGPKSRDCFPRTGSHGDRPLVFRFRSVNKAAFLPSGTEEFSCPVLKGSI